MKKSLKQYVIGSLAVGTLLVFGASVANAAMIFSIDRVDGDWQNVVGGSNVNLSNSGVNGGTSTVEWGGTTDKSGYDFTTSTTPFNVSSDGTPFILGTFVHNNFAIPSGSAISGVDLDIDLEDIGIFDVTALFNFNHNETPNGGGPPGSDDIVTITNPNVNKLFSYLGQDYFFNLGGFSDDGGNTISNEYRTAEGLSNSADLYARITEVPSEIPEPATMLLIGTGLAGLAGIRLRRKK